MINVYPFFVIGGWLFIVLLSSFLCNKYFPKEKELTRKIVHIGSGPIIPFASWFNLSSQIVIPLASIITICLIVNYRLNLINSIENIERKSFGTIAYGTSITLLIILMWSKSPSAVVVGVLTMSFGDGLAGLIGRKIKSPNWTVLGQRKSIAGTLTMGIVGILVLYITSQVTGIPLDIVDMFFIAFLGVILEQISPLGIDNITVPIGVAISWQWIVLN